MDRLFVGIEIPDDIKKKFLFLMKELNTFRAKVVPYENVHLTIKFIGETEKTDLVVDALNDIVFESFYLSISGVGVFQSVYSPRVFWVGVEETEELLKFFNVIQEKLYRTVGIPKDERNFLPHITLSRFKKPVSNIKEFIKFIDEYQNEKFGKFEVREFVLFKSILKEPDPVYSVVKKFSLKIH